MKYLALICAMVAAPVVEAQTFRVQLGQKALGDLSFSQRGQTATLLSTLDNTPLGVFNGSFTGTSRGGVFTGDSKSSRKQRRVIAQITDGRAVRTEIVPAAERTDLSDVARVPAGVRDPVRAIAALIGANGCPAPMRLYDGRRVIALAPDGEARTGDTLTCAVKYKVIAGPGHLSPLRISNANMQLTYRVGTAQALSRIQLSSGIFKLTLDRIE